MTNDRWPTDGLAARRLAIRHGPFAIRHGPARQADGARSDSRCLISGAGLRARGASLRNGHGGPFHWFRYWNRPWFARWVDPVERASVPAAPASATGTEARSTSN